MNKSIVMGRFTSDPEIKPLGNGTSVAKFSLAVRRTFKNKDGNKQEETDFVECEAFGYTAENIGKFFAKGRPILIEGSLRQDKWEDKDTGANRSKLYVVVDSFDFVDNKPPETTDKPLSKQNETREPKEQKDNRKAKIPF